VYLTVIQGWFRGQSSAFPIDFAGHHNIMQIVLLVIPGVRPGYRGAGPWPGVGVPQQRRASVAAVARP